MSQQVQRTSPKTTAVEPQRRSISIAVVAATEGVKKKKKQFTSQNTESGSALKKKARLFSPAVVSQKIAKQIAI